MFNYLENIKLTRANDLWPRLAAATPVNSMLSCAYFHRTGGQAPRWPPKNLVLQAVNGALRIKEQESRLASVNQSR